MAKGVNFTFKATNAAKPAMTGFRRDLKGVQSDSVRAAKEAAALSRETDRLRQKFNPASHAAAQLKREVRDLARAHELGIVDLKMYTRQMRVLERANQLGSIANRRFAQSLGGSSWRRQVQQAGMQVSDMAVQFAGGQSLILAATQNVPQFIQNFGAIGGVLAAVVTILGTIAFSWSRAASNAKTFSKQIEETSGVLEKYFNIVKSGEAFGASTFREAEELLNTTSQAAKDLFAIAKIRAFDSVELLNESLAKSVMSASWLKTAMADAGDVLNVETLLRGNITVWKDNREQVRAFMDELTTLDSATTIDDMFQSATRLRDIFKSHVDVTGEMNTEQLAFWENLSRTIQKMQLLGAAQDAQTSSQERAIAAAKQHAQSRVAAEQIAAREVTRINAETARTIETGFMRARAAQATLGSEGLREMIDVFEASRDLREELGDAAFEAVRLSGVDITSGIDAAAKAASRLAVKLNVSLNAALAIARLAKAAGRTPEEIVGQGGGGGGRGSVVPNATDIALMGLGGVNVNEITALNERARKNRGGGGKPKVNPITEMLKDAHPELKRLFDEQVKLTEDSAKKIKDAFTSTQQAISSAMLSGFKGLLDGSKSFGEAARDILGSIADRVIDLLMTPIFDKIAGNLAGGLIGGLAGGGIMSFDGGGYTGAGVRAGGIDGKGGRLAMLHPNETVEDHTKGQGRRDGTTVVMNIQTPDAESFRRSERQIARRVKKFAG